MKAHSRIFEILVFVLFCCCPLLSEATAPYAVCDAQSKGTIDATHDNMPTWQDVALEDILASPNNGSVEAPSCTPRVHHNGYDVQQQITSGVATSLRHCRPKVAPPHRTIDYFIYYLYRINR